MNHTHNLTTRSILSLALAAALAPAVMAADPQAAADRIRPPAVPADLQAPAGDRPYLLGHAYGTQNYVCLPSASGPAWAFFAPQATLFDDDREQIITHFLSPNPADNGTPRATWQHSKDTSSVWAVPIATSSDPAFVAPDSIPWLLLQVVTAQYGPHRGDKLIRTTVIQRVNTQGGIAPTTGCAVATDIGKKALVPYSADYVFYKH